jgi:hypothetical protein
MSNKSFLALKKALEEALAYECGKRRDLPVTRINPNVQKARDVLSRSASSSLKGDVVTEIQTEPNYRRVTREQNLSIRFDTSLRSKVSHSQMTKTSQPSARRALSLALSRLMFVSNLSAQYWERVLGLVVR